ncbi:MAG: carbohydrate ABC transporter permease [Candidatus Dormibacteraeota bacterium]|nr:carbohydrate ABC transporter permease [Candidatus Dormibacteraeota bacterium]
MFIGLVAAASVVTYPILFTFNAALKDEISFRVNIMSPAWPPHFDALVYVAKFVELPWSLAVSVFISCTTVALLWVIGGLAAFGLTKTRLPFRSVAFWLILGSLLVPIQVVLSPLFLVLRDIGLLNTLQGLILASAAFQLPIATFLFSAYLRRIPNEIVEAASVDGASTIAVIWYIIAPLSRPILATVGAISFVLTWNELLIPIIVLQDSHFQTLTVRTAQLRGSYSGDPVQLTAGVAIAMVPMLLVYLIAQRHLIAAVTVGASR